MLYKAGDDGTLSRIHTFQYYPRPSQGRGYIMDGRGDMAAPGLGKLWRYASAEWDAFFRHVVKQHVALTPVSVPLAAVPVSDATLGLGAPATGPAPASPSAGAPTDPKPWPLALVGTAVLLGVAAMLWVRIRPRLERGAA